MAIGGSGVGGSAPSGGDMDRIVELAKFFNSGENLAKMKELADKEKEIEERLALLGGAERAKELVAEAEEVRRRADDYRDGLMRETTAETDRLKKAARDALASAEASRGRAQREFQDREDQVKADERDIASRKKAIEKAEADIKSAWAKVQIAERAAEEKQREFQEKVAASKRVWG